MTLQESTVPLFANHQTFHPRFGWIKKGYDAALRDPGVFSEPDAPVLLGVGKNMVEAIRFWATATKVLVRSPHPDRPRQSVYVPSCFGASLFDENYGLDPYAEDPSTLWILHWQALTSLSQLPIWRSAFNDFTPVEFTEQALFEFCVDEVAATTWKQPTAASIGKDVDCLLRMYTRREAKARQTLDELLDSPFRELGLIAPSPSGAGKYRFVRGPKQSLSAAAIVYTCLDFMSREGQQKTASSTRLAVDPGSPGRLLKISEDDITQAVEEVSGSVGGISLARPAGTSQIVLDGSPELLALAVLNTLHKRRGHKPADINKLAVSGSAPRTAILSEGELADQLASVGKASVRGRQGVLL
uniref:DUF4007 family protein n=1 Tax=Gordonia sp. B7-2 TaxID=3420932 RepID=UPI003D8C1DDD